MFKNMLRIISYVFCRYLLTNKNYQNVFNTSNIEYNILTYEHVLNYEMFTIF
jgi:hypothetical protein